MQAAQDPAAALYVATNLQSNNPRLTNCAKRTLKSAQLNAIKTLNMAQMRDSQILLIVTRLQQPEPVLPTESIYSLPGPGGPFTGPRPLLSPLSRVNAEKQWFLRKIDELRYFAELQKGLDKLPQAELVQKIHDPSPALRWLAIQAAGRERVPCEQDLIKRLNDPLPEIRQAARAALVRLARGTDFGPTRLSGPTPVAYAREVNEAMANWRLWLKGERSASPGASSQE